MRRETIERRVFEVLQVAGVAFLEGGRWRGRLFFLTRDCRLSTRFLAMSTPEDVCAEFATGMAWFRRHSRVEDLEASGDANILDVGRRRFRDGFGGCGENHAIFPRGLYLDQSRVFGSG
jgi:hypothetical protein